MQAKSELYKGIEYIRIPNLPVDQKELFLKSLGHDKVIKILKDDILISDCILYSDYDAWFRAQYPTSIVKSGSKPLAEALDLSLLKN